MARILVLPIEAVLVLQDAEDRMSMVQVLLLACWLVAVAVHRAIVKVQELCLYLWYLLQCIGEGDQGDARFAPAAGRDGGMAVGTEVYWRDLVDNPESWWDNRVSRKNPRAPDFKHRVSKKALWIDNAQTPAWVRTRFESQ